MLFQSVHFEFETGVGVEEAPGLVLVFWVRWPNDFTPNRALMKLGAGELGRLLIEYRPPNEVSPFISVLTKLLDLRNFAQTNPATPEKVAPSELAQPENAAL